MIDYDEQVIRNDPEYDTQARYNPRAADYREENEFWKCLMEKRVRRGHCTIDVQSWSADKKQRFAVWKKRIYYFHRKITRLSNPNK